MELTRITKLLLWLLARDRHRGAERPGTEPRIGTVLDFEELYADLTLRKTRLTGGLPK